MKKSMKRWIAAAAALFVLLPAAAQMQEAYPSYIQVYGRAEKEITPDEFYLQIVINERDSKGKISVESQQREMIAALKRAGVDVEKQLKVANLSSEFFKKNTSVASAKYQLQLGSAAEVSKVWQELGVLKEGAAGDVIIVDYDPLTPMNENNINSHLLFGVTGHDVMTTVANGEVLMKDRRLTKIDTAKVMADCRQAAAELAGRING